MRTAVASAPRRHIDYATVPRVFDDQQTVVCIATGPSLEPTDVKWCSERAHLIAINDAMFAAPSAAVGYSSDLSWIRHHGGAPMFTGLKFSIEQSRGRGTSEHRPWREWQVLRNTGEQGLETNPSGLRTGKNSGAAAINLAVHLGARRIVLIGYDCGGTHFFGTHPKALQRTSPWPVFRQHFDLMVAPLRTLGVEVINGSRTTTITAFRRQPLDEALP